MGCGSSRHSKQLHSPTLTELEIAQFRLVDAHSKLGRLASIVTLSREAVGLFTDKYGEKHSITGRAQHHLAQALADVKDYHEAVEVARASIATLTATLGPHAFLTIAAKCRLPGFLWKAGYDVEAMEASIEAVDLCETVLGHDHPKTLHAIKNKVAIQNLTGVM